MKKNLLLLLALMLATACGSPTQDLSMYQKHFFVSEMDTLPYRLLLPEGYNANQQYPLLLFLHGAGERGNDNEKQLTHGGSLFIREDVRHNYPCIVVAPQCATSSYWSNVLITHDSITGTPAFNFQEDGAPTRAMAATIKLLHDIINNYAVDKNRIYVGGLSMGGMGTFEIARRNPDIFAAAFPLCGGAHPATARDLRNTAWWLFHGAQDNVVAPVHSQNMFMALQAEGVSAGFTLYPHADHNCWDAAFADTELLKWLFNQQKR